MILNQLEIIEEVSEGNLSDTKIWNKLMMSAIQGEKGEQLAQQFRQILNWFINIGTTFFNLLIAFSLYNFFEDLSLPWYIITVTSIGASQISIKLVKLSQKFKKDFTNTQASQILGINDFIVAFSSLGLSTIFTTFVLDFLNNFT